MYFFLSSIYRANISNPYIGKIEFVISFGGSKYKRLFPMYATPILFFSEK